MAAEEGKMIHVKSVEEWKGHLEKALETKQLVVVDFTASWCGPCRFIAPILEGIAEQFAHVLFLKVDVDELRTVAEEWAVESMPTFILLKEGSIVDKIIGANKDALIGSINNHAGGATASA